MLITPRRLLLLLSIIVTTIGIVLLVEPGEMTLPPGGRVFAWVIVACGAISAVVLNFIKTPSWARERGLEEPDDINALAEGRRRELMRGASQQLVQYKYRYSIRADQHESGERRAFNADVNTVRLGFVPAIITDNTNDRQGYGYVAFVHDGHRWRGPGLPCPAGQAEAVRHAARCVSPLATEEESRF